MSIKCEVILNEYSGSYKPGDNIRGVVRYVLSEETLFHRIAVSLRGFGELYITWKEGSGSDERTETYRDKENYVDIDYVNIDDLIKDNQKNGFKPAGTHDIPFTFTLPEDIPPSFDYKKYITGYNTRCKIFYYIRVKFERPGFSKLNKKYRAEINVDNSPKATILMTPIVHGVKKKPFQPFQSKDKTIGITCTVGNSVTAPGGLIKINYVIENLSNLKLKAVKITLTEEITFKRKRYSDDITDRKTIDSTDILVLVLVKGVEKQVAEFAVNIPQNVLTMQNSNQVSRNYFLNIIGVLPFPHRDTVLKMPIEIVKCNLSGIAETANQEDSELYDPPPSYSEVMAEYLKDGILLD